MPTEPWLYYSEVGWALPTEPWLYYSEVGWALPTEPWLYYSKKCKPFSEGCRIFHDFWSFITLFMVLNDLLWTIADFILFRFFDILKPWPIGLIDRKVKGGIGIMLDDVLAGIVACLILHGAALMALHMT